VRECLQYAGAFTVREPGGISFPSMRIRSIKPEFWASESLSRVSREARLLFVGLFSACDDHGRTRAASRFLASLLFPYDTDAPKRMDAWIEELEKEGCVRRYIAEGDTYLEIPKWTSHQKIDRPSPSKFPSFDAGSVAPREDSRGLVIGSGIREQGEEQGKASPDAVEEIRQAYPSHKRIGKPATTRAIKKALGGTGGPITAAELLEKTKAYALAVSAWPDDAKRFVPNSATWFNDARFNDPPETWARKDQQTAQQKPDRINFKHDDYANFST